MNGNLGADWEASKSFGGQSPQAPADVIPE